LRGDLHPDIQELNFASERGIDTVRQLAEAARLSPTYKARVFILDEAQAATAAAWGCALKVLEEPPETARFVLLTTDPEKIPDTIHSRCFRITLRPIPEKELAEYLVYISKKEHGEIAPEDARRLASAARGHPREALTLLEQALLLHDSSKMDLGEAVTSTVDEAEVDIPDLLRAVFDADTAGALKISDAFANQVRLLEELVLSMRAMARISAGGKVDGYAVAKFGKLAKKVHVDDSLKALRIVAKYLQQARAFSLPADVCLDLALIESSLLFK
jgi:DNA polymerase-3 subunit gamma/tau